MQEMPPDFLGHCNSHELFPSRQHLALCRFRQKAKRLRSRNNISEFCFGLHSIYKLLADVCTALKVGSVAILFTETGGRNVLSF